MDDQNDHIERALAFMESCLENGAFLIDITCDSVTREMGLDVQYGFQESRPMEYKYYQGHRDGLERFICEKAEDVVRAVRERIESDKPFSAGEIVRHFRTRMIDNHELVEWYVYILDKN